MLTEDALKFSGNALIGAKVRTWLMLLAMAIGIGSVVVLTALGEGARRYVSNEFSGLGTHLLVVMQGAPKPLVLPLRWWAAHRNNSLWVTPWR